MLSLFYHSLRLFSIEFYIFCKLQAKRGDFGRPTVKQVAQRNLPIWASEIASRWNICFANVKCSLREHGQISFHIERSEIFHNRAKRLRSNLAHYFTFCLAKHFTYIYRPTIRFYKCNTLYLAGKACEKEYEQNCLYSFCCRAGVYLPPFSLHI